MSKNQTKKPSNTSSERSFSKLLLLLVVFLAQQLFPVVGGRLLPVEVPTKAYVLLALAVITVGLVVAYGLSPIYRKRYEPYVNGIGLVVTVGLFAWAGILGALAPRPGLLSPGDQPEPEVVSKACGSVPEEFTRVILGSFVHIVPVWPFRILSFGQDVDEIEENALILEQKSDDGSILVSTILRDEEGRLIARIEKNKLTDRGNGYPEWGDDNHSLKVFDQRDDVVLDIQFLNRNTVQITGTFRKEGIGIVEITENQTVFLPNDVRTMGNICINRAVTVTPSGPKIGVLQ